jgi:hypothetical protein
MGEDQPSLSAGIKRSTPTLGQAWCFCWSFDLRSIFRFGLSLPLLRVWSYIL